MRISGSRVDLFPFYRQINSSSSLLGGRSLLNQQKVFPSQSHLIVDLRRIFPSCLFLPPNSGVSEIALQKSGLGQIDVYLMLLCHRDLFSR